ncbi:maleylpyruvate isomerase family mycothiol-dependent enzyme [Prauserella cavernicola]|uniref:Maleylpyruvate isomerase family mycothiol-dependent enzyme n=1 Tax=Prauserella cavernicola TaxID=2800127 RepID=A0A934V3L4_9PSEU|nr:maleylpyruvate isomerase family mycothiol-dependent enzyme [Prauserella cavernicola]MBK1783160.1 maleylpyruvate isomerase family mycothiol-dependent enzyme [Prauserella cavernicola]
MNLISLAAAERAELADLLAALTPQQWDTPSLCEGWTVRDVVAHMLSYDELDGRELLRRAARGRFTPGRINAVGLEDYGSYEPADLLALLARNPSPRGLTAVGGGFIGLTDALIHHQDIRRPLGLPREIPAERLRPAFTVALYAPVIRGVLRVRGLRLVATDLDWTWGRGEVVRGKAEALLLAIAGRAAVVPELSGPGQATLVRRSRRW